MRSHIYVELDEAVSDAQTPVGIMVLRRLRLPVLVYFQLHDEITTIRVRSSHLDFPPQWTGREPQFSFTDDSGITWHIMPPAH